MRKNVICVAAAAALSLMIGCEWESSSDGDSWNDAYSWVNFGGVYRPTGGNTYVVSAHAPGSSSPGSTATATQSIGTGNGVTANFNGTLSNTPVVAGTVSVASGSFSLVDDGNGALSGDGSGTVNYNTGAVVANFTLAPGVGNNVLVTYHYSVAGSPANPAPGSSQAIYTITVDQTGQRLAFVDSNGVTYSGNITSISQGGGDSSGLTSGSVVANFSVTGSNGATITGTLQGDYTAPGVTAEGAPSGTGTLANRIMQGTYSSSGGGTGDVLGSAGSVAITVTTTGTGGATSAVARVTSP